MKVKNFGEMLNYIKKYILEPATEELEADDLQMSIYENEITFQINALYDGMEFTYDAVKDKITVEYPIDKRDTTMTAQEAIQVGKMAKFLEENKDVMAKFLLG